MELSDFSKFGNRKCIVLVEYHFFSWWKAIIFFFKRCKLFRYVGVIFAIDGSSFFKVMSPWHCKLTDQTLDENVIKQRRKMYWNYSTVAFLVNCKQIQHPSCGKLSYRSAITQNRYNWAMWYVYSFHDFANFQTSTIQSRINDFLNCFKGSLFNWASRKQLFHH